MENPGNNSNYDMSYIDGGTASAAVNDVKYLFPPKRTFEKREKIFAWIFSLVGFLLVRAVIVPLYEYGAIGLGASVMLLSACLVSFIFTKKRTVLHYIRFGTAVLFSLNVFFTANTLIQILSGIFAMLVLLYDNIAASGRFSSAIRPQFVYDIMEALLLPLSKIGEFFGAYKLEKGFGKNLRNTLLGLLIAVPATLIAGDLLASADPRFGFMISAIFSDSFSEAIQNVIYFIVGIPAAVYLFSAAYLSAKNEYGETDTSGIKGFIAPSVGTVSVIPVCVLYVIYFFSQLSYHLSAFEAILPAGAETYSDYAREGFFQLCGVAVINLIMIAAVNLFCVKDGEKTALSVRTVSVILSLFTIALIAIAMSKMMLYINAYGLTRLRIYTSWFMVLLGLCFIVMIIDLIRKINLARVTVYIFTVMFTVLAFGRTDAVIAEYNFSRAADGTLGQDTIGSVRGLSSDCAPVITKYFGSDSTLHDSYSGGQERTPDIITLSDIIADAGVSSAK